MRKRAELIGQLVVWSEVGIGTKVKLRIPAAMMAYTTDGGVRGCRRSLRRRHEDHPAN